MIARDAFRFLIPLIILTAASFWLSWVLLGVFLLLLTAFVAFFFRNPTRIIPADPSIIVSPGDGKVVKIERVGAVTKMSIFLSLFNVHVNRSPIAGRIEAVDYRKGTFKAAYNPAASIENERNMIMVRNGRINLVFTQIAGVVARRIVFWKKVGDTVEKGELVGLIRFGSRIDILFPAGTEVTVKVGDRVRGGSSPLEKSFQLKMAEKRGKRKSAKGRTQLRSERLQSGLALIPSMFTIGNMFCAYYSVISTFKGNYDYAAMAIGVGVVLDGLDGRIARMTQTASEFGVQLDSIADVLTFGIAPAFLAFSWGQSKVVGSDSYFGSHLHSWSWIVTFVFMICGAWRLARFNVQSQKPADTGAKRYFVGLPIPAGAGLIAAIVHFFKSPIEQIGPAVIWYLLVLLTGFLMASTVRYTSFKELHFLKRGSRLTLVITATLIGSIYFYSEVMLLLISAVYVSSGLIMQTMRRFSPPAPALGEPAHGNIKS